MESGGDASITADGIFEAKANATNTTGDADSDAYNDYGTYGLNSDEDIDVEGDLSIAATAEASLSASSTTTTGDADAEAYTDDETDGIYMEGSHLDVAGNAAISGSSALDIASSASAVTGHAERIPIATNTLPGSKMKLN